MSKESGQLRAQGRLEQAIDVASQALELAQQHFGDVHLSVAQPLADLAALYNEIRDYASAEPLLHKALTIWRAQLGDQRPETMSALSNLARVNRSMGNYSAAAAYFREVIDLWRALGLTAFPKFGPDFADRLTELGLVYYSIDRVQAEQAVPLFREALEIRRRLLGQEDPKVVASLRNLAYLNRSLANYTEAGSLFAELVALERRLHGETSPVLADSLMDMADVERLVGRHAAAGELLEQALSIYRNALGEHHDRVATALNNLGFVRYSMGSYAEAEQWYLQSLEIHRGVSEPDESVIATHLNNLAELYKETGNFARAELHSREALEIRGRVLGSKHPDTAQSVNNLAALFRAMGDYVAAEPLFLQALEMRRAIFGEEHPDFADGLHNLGNLYILKGDVASAEPLLQWSLQIRRTAFGDEHPDVADSLADLSGLCCALGRYAEAERLSRQCLQLRRKIFGSEHARSLMSASSLACILLMNGDYDRAEVESLLREALETTRRVFGDRQPLLVGILSNLAAFCAATDRESEALGLLEQLLAIEDEVLRQIFSFGAEDQRMAFLSVLRAGSEMYLSLIVHHFAAVPRARAAALDLILRRKALGAEALAAQRDAVLAGRYPHLESALQSLRALSAELARRTLAGPEERDPAVHRQWLAKMAIDRATMERELARQIPEMDLDQVISASDRRTISQKLPVQSALVEFVRWDAFDFKAAPARGQRFWQSGRYLAFVLRAGKADDVLMFDLGDAEHIDNLIAAFRGTVTGESEGRGTRDLRQARSTTVLGQSRADGADLREVLFDPLAVALEGCRHIILAPDGDLTRLPFEILPMIDGRHLIDVYNFSYVSVGRDVLRFDVHSAIQPSGPLVVADPDFDLNGGEAPATEHVTAPHRLPSRDLNSGAIHFERLPGTRVEGERIADQLGGTLLLAGSALKGRVKGHPSPSILHLATHGFFFADQPHEPNAGHSLGIFGETIGKQQGRLLSERLENPLLRSGLALAGANTWMRKGVLPDEAEDGILTAEDVSGLDLLSTDLVVLSACETGLGQVRSGEGVFGLRRSFVLAGAKTLVMSLWKVDDERTQELMEDFHGRLLQGEPRAGALRQAQLAIKANYPEPCYWGAFICQGDPGPLPKPRLGRSCRPNNEQDVPACELLHVRNNP